MEFCMTVNGRIVIPLEIRRKFGIKEGTRVQIDVDEKARCIILTPVTRGYIQSLCGKYTTQGLLTALAAQKRRERNR